MSLRVAFDMDGTVADMQTVLGLEAARLFGEAPPADRPALADGSREADPPASSGVATGDPRLTAAQQSQLWAHVRGIENFWTTLPEMTPGIVARIAETSRRRRWEVIFITTRPACDGDTTQRQTQRWLEAHGFASPSVLVLQRSRGRLADVLQLDAVVDDRPENCVDVASDSQAVPILIWQGEAGRVPAGFTRMGVRPVPSIVEALTLLERLDDDRDSSRVTRTIRRLLKRGPG
jgi:hypothetical protein